MDMVAEMTVVGMMVAVGGRPQTQTQKQNQKQGSAGEKRA